MALTTVEKDLLRYIISGKTPDEMKAIGASDDLAREKIAEYVEQQSQPSHDIILERYEETLLTQLADVTARKVERVKIKDLISQLAGE